MQAEIEGAASGGDVPATSRLQELFLAKQRQIAPDAALDRKLVAEVLDHARRVVAHPSRPQMERSLRFSERPFAEIDLEETLEETPILSQAEDYWVREKYEKPFSCVAILDTSSSMSGEKHLLASVAIAVMLLEVESKGASVVVFSSDALPIKKMLSVETPEATVLKFLKTKPRGFTNIHKGLSEGLAQLRGASEKKKIALIATDGRSTEGGDPLAVAERFDCLGVLHLHGPGSYLEGSKELAVRGKGVCLEVEEFSDLPRRLYEMIRHLARR